MRFVPFIILAFSYCLSIAQGNNNLLVFSVDAGEFERENTPVCIALTGEASLSESESYQLFEISNQDEKEVDFQVSSELNQQLCWILTGKTKAGSKRLFAIRRSEKSYDPQHSTGDEDGSITIMSNQRQVLSYKYEKEKAPEGSSSLFGRGGYIHPLYSPQGEVLTRIQPPDHFHHYGIWNPWTHTTIEGRETDFWNLIKAQGTVEVAGKPDVETGRVFTEIKALHHHVDLQARVPTGAQTVLNEDWNIKVWHADPDQNTWLVDVLSTMQCATDSVFKIDAYRYQGFGYRATEKWNDENTRLLTSEGFNKSDGNATRARWCDINGPSSTGRAGILFMTHPRNHNFPEQLRIWPTGANNGIENVFFNFNPAQEEDWVLYPGKSYTLAYRMMVYDGEITPGQAERYWSDFAYPPEVELILSAPKDNKKILVYTKNGEGYVHDNIAASIECIKTLGKEYGFEVEASDDPFVMTEENLKQYHALVFSNTNNETFDTEDQKLAFQQYVEAGGGFVGIHSASGSEREWSWFASIIGGRFRRHPPLQPFDIKVLDRSHPSTLHLDDTWKWEDECYYLYRLNPGMHILLAADMNTVEDDKKSEYPGDLFGELFPLSWSQEIGKGRQWYTALGHKIEYYQNEEFRKHLAGGILWVLDGVDHLDYNDVSDTLRIN